MLHGCIITPEFLVCAASETISYHTVAIFVFYLVISAMHGMEYLTATLKAVKTASHFARSTDKSQKGVFVESKTARRIHRALPHVEIASVSCQETFPSPLKYLWKEVRIFFAEVAELCPLAATGCIPAEGLCWRHVPGRMEPFWSRSVVYSGSFLVPSYIEKKEARGKILHNDHNMMARSQSNMCRWTVPVHLYWYLK